MQCQLAYTMAHVQPDAYLMLLQLEIELHKKPLSPRNPSTLTTKYKYPPPRESASCERRHLTAPPTQRLCHARGAGGENLSLRKYLHLHRERLN